MKANSRTHLGSRVALSALQRLLENLPVRGKARLANVIFDAIGYREVECHPLRSVTIHLDPTQRIERLMWAGAYERELLALLQRFLRPGMTVADVGANIGYFSAISAGLVGSDGAVHAFEPVPRCFAQLRKNLATFGWARAYPCAIGDAVGHATIHFDEAESGWGSLLDDKELPSATEVDVMTLDAWAQHENLTALDFIKIDAEGAEYRVLKGAHDVLLKLRPTIVAELNAPCLVRDRRTPQDVIDLLRAADYDTFSFNDGVLAIPKDKEAQVDLAEWHQSGHRL